MEPESGHSHMAGIGQAGSSPPSKPYTRAGHSQPPAIRLFHSPAGSSERVWSGEPRLSPLPPAGTRGRRSLSAQWPYLPALSGSIAIAYTCQAPAGTLPGIWPGAAGLRNAIEGRIADARNPAIAGAGYRGLRLESIWHPAIWPLPGAYTWSLPSIWLHSHMESLSHSPSSIWPGSLRPQAELRPLADHMADGRRLDKASSHSR